MGRKFLFLAVLAGLVMAGMVPPQASADFQVVVQEVNSSGVVVAQASSAVTTGSNIALSASVGSYNIVGVFAFQNAGIGGQVAQLDTTALTVSSSGTTDTLRVIASATAYNFPVGNPMTLTSSIGGTSTLGSTITFQSFADNNNSNLFGVTTGYANSINPGIVAFSGGIPVDGSAAAVTTGLQTVNGTGLAFKDDASLLFTGALPFSLTNVTTFSGLTANQSVSTNGNTTLATPAPGGPTLVASALAVLGFGGWLRGHRKEQAHCSA